MQHFSFAFTSSPAVLLLVYGLILRAAAASPITTYSITTLATFNPSPSTTTTPALTWVELVPSPLAPEMATTTVLQREEVTVTAVATETVTETVAVKFGELEFPKAGYAGTVVLVVAAAATRVGGGGTVQEVVRSEETKIYGDGGG